MRVDGVVTVVIVAHDMVHVHRLCHAGPLEQLARVGPQVWVIVDPLSVTFEMQVIDGIKAHQRREQPPIGFGHGSPIKYAVLPNRSSASPAYRTAAHGSS